jgi:hypothetical protein
MEVAMLARTSVAASVILFGPMRGPRIKYDREEKAMRIPLLALALLVFAATPALAGASHLVRYYVGMDPATKKCQVLQARPDGKTMMEATNRWYRNEATANTAMTKIKACK